MKFQNKIAVAAMAVSFGAATNATPIQIDFTANITATYDALGNAIIGVGVGDIAYGRMIFDDEIVPSLNFSEGNNVQNYSSYESPLGLNWISSTIVVNGVTYEAGNGDGEVAFDRFYVEEPLDGFWPGLATLYSSSLLKGYDDFGYFEKGSSLQLYNASLNTLISKDISDIASLANIFTDFGFQSYDVSFPDGVYSPNRNGAFYGTVTSTTIVRQDQPSISVPEPSSFALLAAGMFGIVWSRRRPSR